MATATIEERLAMLEEKVERLLSKREEPAKAVPWWEKHVGAFQDDPFYEEAARLGAEYRRSQPNAADNPDAVEF
jgi:hypothetical protein